MKMNSFLKKIHKGYSNFKTWENRWASLLFIIPQVTYFDVLVFLEFCIMEEFRSVMEEVSENTHLRETHTLVSSLADCSAWKQFLLSFLLKKNMTHENFRIFQATLIWGMFSCFPRSFYKRCSSVMLPTDQSTGCKGPAASFPGVGSTAWAPRGGCAQPITWLLLVLRSSVLEGILSDVTGAERTPSCKCHCGVPLCLRG